MENKGSKRSRSIRNYPKGTKFKITIEEIKSTDLHLLYGIYISDISTGTMHTKADQLVAHYSYESRKWENGHLNIGISSEKT